MPYAPAVSVMEPGGLLFIAGATASPLYHRHPHVPEEHVLPHDMKEQTRRALANIKMVLDVKGLTWRNVVKITKYVTDMRDSGRHVRGPQRAFRGLASRWHTGRDQQFERLGRASNST